MQKKFRMWNTEKQEMEIPDFVNCVNGEIDRDYYPLMQYVGIKDASGKEIYEGDIVSVYNTPEIDCGKYEIVWKGCGFWFRDSDLGSEELYVFDRCAYILNVIGNIYENPELVPKSL